MRFSLLLVFVLSCTTFAAAEIKIFKIDERRGEFIERSTYWFRGSQCVACIRGYADSRMHVLRFREFLDIFYAGKRIATCDPETRSMLFLVVPEGVTFRKDFLRFTIHSKDFTYFEQITIEPADDSGFRISLPDGSQLTANREAFQARKQLSPEERLFLRSYSPHETAPAIEEIQKRAEKNSR